MEFRWLERPLAYDGLQLRSGFARDLFGAAGDSVAAFGGPCRVEGEALVDLADRDAGERIVAAEMVHFIVEHPGASLEVVTLRQRLLVESARTAAEDMAAARVGLVRRGDDIYGGDGPHANAKLSVSVATVSPTGGVIHLGVNVDAAGAPVRALSLAELGVEPEAFAREVFRRYNAELDMVRVACGKVRPVE